MRMGWVLMWPLKITREWGVCAFAQFLEDAEAVEEQSLKLLQE